MAQLKVVNCPAQELALTNCAFVAPADAPRLGAYVELGAAVLSVRANDAIEPGCVALNAVQRRNAQASR